MKVKDDAGEMSIPLVLLPGMDGTGSLFDEFVRALPAHIVPFVVAYPGEHPMGYDELEAWLAPRLPAGRFALLGESFSGPLAVRVALAMPDRVTAIVLVATFTESPVPRWLRWLVPTLASLLFRIPPPRVAVRFALAGMDAPEELVDRALAAISSVSAIVLATRAQAITSLKGLAGPRSPTLCLAGNHDRIVGSQHRRALHVKEVVIDAPHFVLQRCPRESAAAVAAFLAAHATTNRTGGAAPAR